MVVGTEELRQFPGPHHILVHFTTLLTHIHVLHSCCQVALFSKVCPSQMQFPGSDKCDMSSTKKKIITKIKEIVLFVFTAN